MSYQIKKALRDVVKTFIPDAVVYNHITLPAKHFRLCGQEFRDDAFYLQSAELEAKRLVEHFDLSLQSRVLDVGCGVGRLAIGIIKDVGDIQNYTGIDVMQRPIVWCQKHIGQQHPTFHFMHIDVANPLYNPTGKAIGSQFRLPFADHSFDIVYLYSVFSHMTTEHVQAYLGEFHRILSPAGGIFLTAFVEKDVPDMIENPENYRKKWDRPLHCVRYNDEFFASLLEKNSLRLDRFDHEKEADGQSGLYIRQAT